jgi:hypothetical protein
MSILGNTSLMNFVLECCERQVIEEEFQEKDSRSGKETKHVSRGVGEKGLSVTRKRTSEGREERLDTLHNLNEGQYNLRDFCTTHHRTTVQRTRLGTRVLSPSLACCPISVSIGFICTG